MKWERQENGDWKAQGEKGDFLIWKIRRGFYKARYRSLDQSVRFEVGVGDITKLKKRCEANYYWE